MVKKKGKSTRKLRKRVSSWTEEDVRASTSLPPQVEGQLRCYLKVAVSQILWMIPSPPEITQARIQWWGEAGSGTVYRPVDVKNKVKGANYRTTARFPIRSGPKQFAAYLNDMNGLLVEVLSGPMAVPVARCQVDQICNLAPNRPINGFFPVFSADSEKVAELQVSITLESLMASYDSQSSIPTPDMSVDVYSESADPLPVRAPSIRPQPPPAIYSSADDPFRSPAAHKSGGRNPGAPDMLKYASVRDSYQSQTSAPSSAGHYGYQNDVTTSNPSYPRSSNHDNQLRNTMDSNASTLKGISSLQSETSGPEERSSEKKTYSGPTSSVTNSVDLVSALIEKGAKLREAMIISTLDDPRKPNTQYTDPGYSVVQRKNSTGDLFREILNPGGESAPDVGVLGSNPGMGLLDGSDTEGRAVDLVIGDQVTDKEFKMLKALGGSPGSSISGDDMLMESDLADPVHDDSLLEELFYKDDSEDSEDLLSGIDDISPSLRRRSRSRNSLSSLDDPGNARPPSRHSTCSSPALDHDPVRDTDPIPAPSRSRPRTKSKKKKNPPGSQPRSRSRSRSASRDGKKKMRDRPGDLEVPSSPRISETGSRVSFDPAPSDVDEDASRPSGRSPHKAIVDGLSIERLTLLGRVHVARVMVEEFRLTDDIIDTPVSTPRSRAKTQRGKPPRPQKSKKKQTYFVEYQFPVVATSRDKHQPNAMATEVMRVASKKVTDNTVSLGHRSVFPVMFDGDTIEKWWKSALVFKVYSKTAGQKVPRLLGLSSLPLKSVLKSESLFIDRSVEVKDRNSTQSDSSRCADGLWPVVGNLKISVELASDHKDFSTALAKTRLAELTSTKIIPIPPPRPKPRPGVSPSGRKNSRERQHRAKSDSVAVVTQTEPQSTNINSLPLAPPVQPRISQPTLNYHQGALSSQPIESLTLHTLLLVPDGSNITLQGVPLTRHGERSPSSPPKPLTSWTGRDQATRNLYLVSRMFWSDDIARSGVCWGTYDPPFNFVQVAPMLLTAALLERMRNNFMIIEVWDKKTSSDNDQLVGIVKLPLHQFYMSYRDHKIATSLLKSQYPVISIDTDVSIVNPFSGCEFGKLKVLLAMGSTEQVGGLQKLKTGQGSALATAPRPEHYLERHHVYSDGRQPQSEYSSQDNTVEHVFEVCVEGIKGLRLLDTMIWGEADCFLQYHFPTQKQTRQQGGPDIIHATPSLQSFRTATTLCVPDPVFNDVMRHKISLSEGTPVQREILTACAGVGGGVGGIPFEVWCRYYYPNVRDQVIAKGTLPLAKLCAMVTMQRKGEQNTQSFSVALSSLVPESDENTNNTQVPECGLLDVTMNYRSTVQRRETGSQSEGLTRSQPNSTVCVAVGIIRASGLQAAAKTLAKYDAGMQYVSEVGVNTYIRIKLSFLQKEDERITRTVARSFAPEFGYHLDFPCPLLWTELGSDALSLAEILESAEAVFELWHQAPNNPFGHEPGLTNTGTSEVQGRRLVSLSGDVLLGTVTVPLLGLLTKKTGVSGWFSVVLPSVGWDQTSHDPDLSQSEDGHHGNRGLERVIGGLELTVKFAHHEDLDRVVHAARGVGWAPDFNVEHRDWDSADELLDHYHQIIISIDLCIFPMINALITGQTKLDKAARCYVRYKLYDKGATCSRLCELEPNDDGYVTADLQHSKTLIIAGSSPFSWYLREERLEVQVWVTYHTEDGRKQRPRNRDKLIGSAYWDMASLADGRRRQHRVSGVFPLFKPGASSLGGACMRAHMTLKPHTGELIDSDGSDLEAPIGTTRRRRISPQRSPMKKSPQVEDQETEVDLEGTFAANIAIDRALHLPTVTDNGVGSAPSAYVSYQTADQSEMTYTDISPPTTDPIWSYNHDTRLSNDLITQANKNLVFKVWHKPPDVVATPDKGVDRVLGFVSVDLAPLVTGFKQICGWYNIMDFNGQCQGQIKVSIMPQQQLANLQPTDSPVITATKPSSLPPNGHSYSTQSFYAAFPTHLAWYPEQKITLNTQNGAAPPAAAEQGGATLPHYSEHFENVKKYHKQLQNRMLEMGVADPNTASRSILFSNLRNNLGELDEITKRLKQKLNQSNQPEVVPPASNHHGHQHHSDPASTQANGEQYSGMDYAQTGSTLAGSSQQGYTQQQYTEVPDPQQYDQFSGAYGDQLYTPATTATDMYPPTTGQLSTGAMAVPTDLSEIQQGLGNLDLRAELGATTLTRGYDAGSESNGISTFNTQTGLLSTQNTVMLSTQNSNTQGTEPGLDILNGLERSENDQTMFTATLQHAQQVLEAIHKAQGKYSSKESTPRQTYPTPHGLPEAYPTPHGLPEVYPTTHGLPEVYPTPHAISETFPNTHGEQGTSGTRDYHTQQDQSGLLDHGRYGDTMEVTDGYLTNVTFTQDQVEELSSVARAPGNYNQNHRDDEDWEEEDTFSRAWAERPSDRHSDIISEISGVDGQDGVVMGDDEVAMGDDEIAMGDDAVVMARPLNDVSSAMFSNAYDESFRDIGDEMLQNAERSLQNTGGTDRLVSEATTHNTSDTFFATHDTSWKGALDTGDLGTETRSALDNVQFEESNGSYHSSRDHGDSYPGSHVNGDTHPTEGDLLGMEDPTQWKNVSRTSLSSGTSHSSRSKNGRKAAMFRREYDRHRGDRSSSGDEDLPRTPHKNRKPKYKHVVSDKPSCGDQTGLEPDPPVRTAEYGHISAGHNIVENGDTGDSYPEVHARNNRQPPTQPAKIPSAVPNFFLPPGDLAQTMKTLTTAGIPQNQQYQVDPERVKGKADAANAYLTRLDQANSSSKSTRPKGAPTKATAQPSQEQAQRIAKIFAQKFS